MRRPEERDLTSPDSGDTVHDIDLLALEWHQQRQAALLAMTRILTETRPSPEVAPQLLTLAHQLMGGQRPAGPASRAGETCETTARRVAEQARQGQKMEILGRLAAGLIHDFNQTLCVIGGCAELVLAQRVLDAEARLWVEEIARAGALAADLTRQWLTFCRQEVFPLPRLDVNAGVTETAKLLRRLIGSHITLDVALAPGLAPIRANTSQVNQVLLNLALNARDAMPQGGRLTIGTESAEPPVSSHSTGRAGAFVVLAVTDTGCGMSAEIRARLFEPFFTTKEPGQGTGIGLVTVAEIVRQLGGHITVESEPGRGSTFRVYFPQAGPDDEPTEGEDARAAAERARPAAAHG